jgi:N-acetyltransferase
VDAEAREPMHLGIEPLRGRFVTLEPYAPELRAEVQAALDCDPDAWRLFASCGAGEHFDGWWANAIAAMEAGEWIPFAIRDSAGGRVVGSTSFLNIRPACRCAEIGATFLHPDVRGGVVNPEAKRLMLTHAFAAGARRVELLTDARNVRSRAAIAKLGAVQEGILHRDRTTWTGHVRDSVLFAIVDLDWPAVRQGLDSRLEARA